MKKKKSFILSFAAIVLGASVLCGCGNSPKAGGLSEEPAGAIRIEESVTDANASDYADTYTFTDNAGNTFHLTLKADETCTLQQEGSDHVYYGSWMKGFNDGEFTADFDIDDTPTIVWPDGEDSGLMPTIKDGYIYSSMSTADAKNPRKRLPCSK